jgi:hypothetical protein
MRTMDGSARMPVIRRSGPVFSFLSERIWERTHGVRSTTYLRGAMVGWLA